MAGLHPSAVQVRVLRQKIAKDAHRDHAMFMVYLFEHPRLTPRRKINEERPDRSVEDHPPNAVARTVIRATDQQAELPPLVCYCR